MPKNPPCAYPGCHRVAHPTSGKRLCTAHRAIFSEDRSIVDWDIVDDFITPWLEAGYKLPALLATAGLSCGPANAYEDGKGWWVRVYRQFVENVDPARCKTHPAWMTARRLRSLSAAGMTLMEMSRETGIHFNTLSRLRAQKAEFVHKHLHDAVIQLWEKHKLDMPRPPERTVRDAGWPLPMEWEDVTDPWEGQGTLRPILRVSSKGRVMRNA